MVQVLQRAPLVIYLILIDDSCLGANMPKETGSRKTYLAQAPPGLGFLLVEKGLKQVNERLVIPESV